MSGGTLHIFNPETDFALGNGGDYFTPKSTIVAMRRRMALLPAIWANPHDTILLLDEPEERMPDMLNEQVKLKHLNLTTAVALKKYRHQDFTAIRPWGWNNAIRRLLLDCNVDTLLIPSAAQIQRLKQKAHRRNTIPFHRIAGTIASLLPVECNSMEQVLQWVQSHESSFLKAPWSSSGRGVYHNHGWNSSVENWVKGVLLRQGSVMAEQDWRRSADFATEWRMAHGKALFLGYSLFNTDANGQYAGNTLYRQNDIEEILSDLGWHSGYLVRQRRALEQILRYEYSGPVGVDCLYSDEYGFNLCVELNLRMTMGMVRMLEMKELNYETIYGR